MEEDFPRGGSVTKPTSSKKEVQRTDVDNLFQVKPFYFLVLLYRRNFILKVFFFYPRTHDQVAQLTLFAYIPRPTKKQNRKKEKEL